MYSHIYHILNKLENIINRNILHTKNKLRKHTLLDQYCKKCGTTMNYDYHIPNEEWEKLPQKYQDHVLCWNCFIQEYQDDPNQLQITWHKMG